MKHSHRFFSNRDCEYFPCHKAPKPERFNCLFCFCPLYFLPECGGRFARMENGFKDCSDCAIPHTPEGYDHILTKLKSCFKSGCTVTLNKP